MTLSKREKLFSHLIFAAFALVILYLHRSMTYTHDDLVIAPTVAGESLVAHFLYRFYSNGKIFTDVLANLFYRVPLLVWKLFDTLVYVAIAQLITHLFTEKTWKDALTVCALILIFPTWYLGTAGWIATATNYLYPVLCLLTATLYLQKVAKGQRLSPLSYVLLVISILYASNQDQAGMILIGGVFLCLLVLIQKKADRKIIGRMALWLCICILCYAALFCLPGHLNRMIDTSEMEYWLPQYAHWTLFEKLYHGYTSTVANLFFGDAVLFPLFSFFLFLVSLRCQAVVKKVIGSLPFLAFVFIQIIGKEHFVVYYPYAGGMPELRPLSQGFPAYFTLFFTVAVVFCMLASVWNGVSHPSRRTLLFSFLLLAAGSREMMCFSPTLYASHARTFTYFLYFLILGILVIFRELKSRENSTEYYLGVGAVAASLFL